MENIQKVIKKINKIDYKLMDDAQKRLDNLTKPQGSLGKLEELAKLLVGITGMKEPETKNKVIFTFAADHGVTKEGVSAFPSEVTAQMVYNFLNGGAAINVLAKHIGARVVVADLGVASDLKKHPKLIIKKINYGTKNMVKEPVMSREEAIKSIESGIEIFEKEFKKGIDIIGTGDMGIGNTTASSAITAVFTGKPVGIITGKGTGINDNGLKNKIKIIQKALEFNKPDSKDAIDVLSKVGGFEIGGLCGVILAAASRKIPVVVDGFISGASALVAYHLEPKVRDYLIASHCSVEKGHKAILEHLKLSPVLNLDMRLGEGTGSALAMGIIEASVKILTQMATFENAGVSGKAEK